ncbi:MAG: MarR family transcriptional regulator [Rhodocyclaceae bacterium]|nr:MarR family transcriptional regulator [Rhodocyclaceae bacterium]
MMSSHQETTVTAWARLMRAQQSLLARVEADLKKSGLPPLRWYDVLLELNRAGSTGLRQYELGAQLLLSKYNLSRLIDRLQKERLVDRQACAEDGRGARVRITDTGLDLLRRMWPVYRAAIGEHFARHFSDRQLEQLGFLLGRVPGVGA